MPSLKELRDELREKRKESVRPVSKMKKEDIVRELEKSHRREEKTEVVEHKEEVKKMVKAVAPTKAKAVKIVEEKAHAEEEKAVKKAHKKEEGEVKAVLKKSPKVVEVAKPVKKPVPTTRSPKTE